MRKSIITITTANIFPTIKDTIKSCIKQEEQEAREKAIKRAVENISYTLFNHKDLADASASLLKLGEIAKNTTRKRFYCDKENKANTPKEEKNMNNNLYKGLCKFWGDDPEPSNKDKSKYAIGFLHEICNNLSYPYIGIGLSDRADSATIPYSHYRPLTKKELKHLLSIAPKIKIIDEDDWSYHNDKGEVKEIELPGSSLPVNEVNYKVKINGDFIEDIPTIKDKILNTKVGPIVINRNNDFLWNDEHALPGEDE